MNYRDDRDALRGRVDQLQQELEEAKRKAAEGDPEAVRERAEALERELAAVDQHLASLRADVRKLRPERRSNGGVIAALAVGGVILTGALFLSMGTLLGKDPMEPPRTIVEPPAPPPPIPPPVPPTPPDPKPVAVPAPAEPRDVTVRWAATVKKATGVALSPGASCSVEAKLATTGTNVTVPHLAVVCGKVKLYDTSESFDGMAQMDNDARETLGDKDDAVSFTLQYSDVGTRKGRAQIEIDSTKGKGIVFRDGLDAQRVELSLPSLSAPTKGLAERFHADGVVASVTGAAPIKPGARCTLRVAATGQQANCVGELRCGGTAIVPVTEPIRCRFEGARLAHVGALAAPSFELDTTDASVEIKSEGERAFGVKIDVDAKP